MVCSHRLLSRPDRQPLTLFPANRLRSSLPSAPSPRSDGGLDYWEKRSKQITINRWFDVMQRCSSSEHARMQSSPTAAEYHDCSSKSWRGLESLGDKPMTRPALGARHRSLLRLMHGVDPAAIQKSRYTTQSTARGLFGYTTRSRTKSRSLLRSEADETNLLLYAHAYGKGSSLHAYQLLSFIPPETSPTH